MNEKQSNQKRTRKKTWKGFVIFASLLMVWSMSPWSQISWADEIQPTVTGATEQPAAAETDVATSTAGTGEATPDDQTTASSESAATDASSAVEADKETSAETDEQTVTNDPAVAATVQSAASGETSLTPQTDTSLTAKVTYNGGDTALTSSGATLDGFSWRGTMTLTVDAYFAEGTDKTVEISLPEGMSFRTNQGATGDPYNQITGLDATLKEQVNPDAQTDAAKQSVTVLGVDQKNGTITLKFHGQGEDNDVAHTTFSLPVHTAAYANRNGGLYESGVFWGYDNIADAVKVTQSIDGSVANTAKLSLTNISGDNKSLGNSTSWTAAYDPEVLVGGTTTGDESWAAAQYSNGIQSSCDAAVKKYSVTFLAPEGVVYAGSKGGNHVIGTGDPVVTAGGATTADGYAVPSGYKAYTWTYTDMVVNSSPTFKPEWTFPSTSFADGDKVTIKVVDEHLQYYGRASEETTDAAKYPSLTYDVKAPYEECFANVKYQTSVDETTGKRLQDGYESDYTLSLGSSGYEHTQERSEGYFILGNRGLADSVAKTIEIDYDVNDTGIIGVTTQDLPAISKVSNFDYKTWDSATNATSGWLSYTPTDALFNLKDVGIAGGGTTFIKAIKFDLDTLPAQQYLKSATTDATKDNAYYFSGRVLTDEVVAESLSSKIKSTVTIVNKDGAATPATVTGRAFDGTSGTSIVVGNFDYAGYPDGTYANEVAVGSSATICHSIEEMQWYVVNAQTVDHIYLISPFGDDYSDIQAHYGALNGILSKKNYLSAAGEADTPQPAVTKVENASIPAELKAKYPSAVVYDLDFTGITDPQQSYDARRISSNTLTAKSMLNTPLATGPQVGSGDSAVSATRQGIYLTYGYSPALTDTPGTYDDLIWIKYSTPGEAATYVGEKNSGYCRMATDEYNLTGDTSSHLGLCYGVTIAASQDLVVDSASKAGAEPDSMYRTYDGTNKSAVGVTSDVDYKLDVQNYTGQAAQGCSVYWPVAKKGQDWGATLCPEGAFNYTLDLKNALQNVPDGWQLYYAKNATPTSNYGQWDSNTWTAQADTSSWTTADWDQVNFVKAVWVGADTSTDLPTGTDSTMKFDLRVDTASATADEMYTKDVWQPYFLRTFATSSSWVAGKPVATELMPGQIAGKVWDDANWNGNIDEGEDVIPGAKVELYDTSTGTDVLRQTVYSDADGKYTFDGIDLSGAVASYTYKVVAYNPTDPTAEGSYITFSKIVTDESGNVTSDMKFAAAADQKTATDTAVAGDYSTEGVWLHQDVGLSKSIPATAPVVTKALTGDTPLSSSTFNFEIAGKTETELSLTKEKASVTGAGKASEFGQAYFSKAGTYTYYITESNDGTSGYTYDPHVYVWTVTASQDETTGVWSISTDLKVKQNAAADDSTAVAAESVVFSNAYAAGPITVTKSVDKSSVKPNDELTYTLTVTNTGTDAQGVWVKDYVPDNTTFVSCDSDGTSGTTSEGKKFVSWFAGDMKSSDTKTYTFAVKVNDGVVSGTVIPNSALSQVTNSTSAPQDPAATDPVNPSNKVETTVVNPTDPGVTKTVSKDTAASGDELTYTLTLANTTGSTLTGYWVKDYLPANTTFVSCDGAGTSGATIGGKAFVSWFFASVAPSESKTMTITVKVNECSDGTAISNAALTQITGTTTPPTDIAGTDPTGGSTNQVTTTVSNPAAPVATAAVVTPRTGDTTPTGILAGLAAAGLAAAALGLLRRKASTR